MKRKRIKNLAVGTYVKCSFCKDKTAETQIVGYPYYGRTVCNNCYKELASNEKQDDVDTSLGEEQAYNIYKVF